MSANYTPFATLTDDELVREVCTKKDVTDLELELMNRLEYYIEYAATLVEELEGSPPVKHEMKYKEAA